MAGVMLDSDICIYAINDNPPEVRRRLEGFTFSVTIVSAIVAAELFAGAAKSARRAKNEMVLRQFLSRATVLDWPTEAAALYGEIRATLERRGKLIGLFDMLIAAHALARDATLITSNVAEFRRVEGLRVESWVNR